jgi:hypothetical protein
MDEVLPRFSSDREGIVRFGGFLTAGYLLFNRTFSYIGIPSARMFIREIVLASFCLLRGLSLLKSFRYVTSINGFRAVAWTLGLLGLYGVVSVLRGLSLGHPVLETLRDSAFVYYTLYLIIGIHIALRSHDHYKNLRRFGYALAVVNGVYGTLYMRSAGQGSELTIPGTPNVWIFAHTNASAVALLMLLAFFPIRRDIIVLIVLNALVLLGIQVRAEWLGFFAAVSVLAILRKNLRLVFRVTMIMLVLLWASWFFQISLPSPVLRGGELSARGIIARAIAPVDPEAAWEFTEHAGMYQGTYVWRVFWWTIIWEEALRSTTKFILGNGFGFDLTGLVGYGEAMGLGGLRTPHSFVAFAVGYIGVVGLALFLLFQLSILRVFFQSQRNSSTDCRQMAQFGVAFVVFFLCGGAFGSTFEAPYGAIPYYLICGYLIGSIFSVKKLSQQVGSGMDKASANQA